MRTKEGICHRVKRERVRRRLGEQDKDVDSVQRAIGGLKKACPTGNCVAWERNAGGMEMERNGKISIPFSSWSQQKLVISCISGDK